MELELKFRATPAALAALAAAPALGDFALGAVAERREEDRYLDTTIGSLHTGGFACRLRLRADGSAVATLKGLGGAAGALHRRAEHNTPLPAPTPDPAEWPHGPARALVERLAAGAPLLPLVTLRQRRRTRAVLHGGALVAELSLDEVEAERPGQPPRAWCEVEIELHPTADPALLPALEAAAAGAGIGVPEPRSKLAVAIGSW